MRSQSRNSNQRQFLTAIQPMLWASLGENCRHVLVPSLNRWKLLLHHLEKNGRHPLLSNALERKVSHSWCKYSTTRPLFLSRKMLAFESLQSKAPQWTALTSEFFSCQCSTILILRLPYTSITSLGHHLIGWTNLSASGQPAWWLPIIRYYATVSDGR